jgi:hypothetical protein
MQFTYGFGMQFRFSLIGMQLMPSCLRYITAFQTIKLGENISLNEHNTGNYVLPSIQGI